MRGISWKTAGRGRVLRRMQKWRCPKKRTSLGGYMQEGHHTVGDVEEQGYQQGIWRERGIRMIPKPLAYWTRANVQKVDGGLTGILCNTLARASLQVAASHLLQLPLCRGQGLPRQTAGVTASARRWKWGPPAGVVSAIIEALELLVGCRRGGWGEAWIKGPGPRPQKSPLTCHEVSA